MGLRKIKIDGYNHDAATTAIVTWNGVVVFNGTLTAAAVTARDSTDYAPGDKAYIFSWDHTNTDDTTETDHTVSIEITNGSATIGNFWVSADNDRIATYPVDSNGDFIPGFNGNPVVESIESDWYYSPGNQTGTYGTGDATDHGERTNVLINGAAPELLGPTTPDNGNSDPRWNVWQFIVESGDTWSATIRIPKIAETYVAP